MHPVSVLYSGDLWCLTRNIDRQRFNLERHTDQRRLWINVPTRALIFASGYRLCFRGQSMTNRASKRTPTSRETKECVRPSPPYGADAARFEKRSVKTGICALRSPGYQGVRLPEQSSCDTPVNEGRRARISRCQTSRPAQPWLFIAPSSAKSCRKSSDSQ